MLKRIHRLPFTRLHKAKTIIGTSCLTVKAQANGMQMSRVGIIVSRRVDNRATKRNSIKRMVRNIIYEHLASLVTGYDMLFIVRKCAKDNPAELKKNVQQVFERLAKGDR
jgi:ribonuclease P protein component